ncbi:hypothetical protein CLI64_20255 [Nostoc sp. CENA543]|uniref:hypothetical protein n=1 Tax=Nostoc sp. CENA543 TaxID=1869241 RepID=UPI000CA199A4|nr:hypothetical protein [Nostoc sp. CENA543]AUT02533.1 hypothetical protein CLI64_20255 [Nostoc sp. CENA543]
MKTKIFGFALLLSLAGFLGACGDNTSAPDATTPATTTTPAEPTDSGTTPPTTPAASPKTP